MSSNVHEAALRSAVEEWNPRVSIDTVQPLSGGCIHSAYRIDLSDGTSLAAKATGSGDASLFEEECDGLAALAATSTVLVPQPFGVRRVGGVAVLLMTYIRSATASGETWARFGQELAALHRSPRQRQYGFDSDNHIGSTAQPNPWTDDWVVFNQQCRIGYQVDLAARSRKLEASERDTLERLVARLGEWLPRNPFPALLHGDLWSGNGFPGVDAEGRPRIAVIDPACSIGDGWADIAMMKLFGGFDARCFRAYEEAIDDHDGVADRLAIYTLYHVLNHLNIFGRSYAGQAVSIARSLVGP